METRLETPIGVSRGVAGECNATWNEETCVERSTATSWALGGFCRGAELMLCVSEERVGFGHVAATELERLGVLKPEREPRM